MSPAGLSGLRCLVTGAASGIGRAVALRLAGEGARLALADRDETGLAAVADQTGASAHPYDAATPGASAAMLRSAAKALGGLDAVLAIAGIFTRGHSTDIPRAEWDRTLSVNLTATFELAQAAHPYLADTKGSFTATASTAAQKGMGYAAAYAASKAGVTALTKSLAAEWAAQGIRVNAVAPGRIKTNIAANLTPLHNADPALLVHPAKLAGTEQGVPPEDIAGLYAFLTSADARYITGQVLAADGGNAVG